MNILKLVVVKLTRFSTGFATGRGNEGTGRSAPTGAPECLELRSWLWHVIKLVDSTYASLIKLQTESISWFPPIFHVANQLKILRPYNRLSLNGATVDGDTRHCSHELCASGSHMASCYWK